MMQSIVLSRKWPWGLILLGIWAVASPGWSGELRREALDADFREQWKRLQLASDEQLRAHLAPPPGQRDPSKYYYFFPGPGARVAVEGGQLLAVELRPERSARLAAIGQQYAEQLFRLATQQLAEQQAAAAYCLLHEVLHYDPQHAEAARILQLPSALRTNGPPISVRAGRIRHARYGWAPGRYWYIESPHFRILTSRSPGEGEALAQLLEQVHAVWRQAFFSFWSSEAALQAAWDSGRAVRPRATRHQVVLFQDRPEYIRRLQQLEPQAEMTLGYYHAASRTAFLFAGAEADPATWVHEVTHQLFHESGRTPRSIAQEANFWAVEGAALYMESLQFCGTHLTLGGWDAARLQFARHRRLGEAFYVPLEQFVRLGQRQLQQDPRIRPLYSQAAGLTHFFLHAEQGKYYDAFVDYLQLIYQGQDRPASLMQLVPVDAPEVDQAYPQFLQVTDDEILSLKRCAPLRGLALARTDVTDRGLLALPAWQDLQWLTLAGTAVTGRGLAPLARATKLRQLMLENTAVDDATVGWLEHTTALEELDLSGTQITDATLRRVGQLGQLKSLWLSQTAISDAGLAHLHNLTKLETLGLSGTRVTDAGRAALQQALPNVTIR